MARAEVEPAVSDERVEEMVLIAERHGFQQRMHVLNHEVIMCYDSIGQHIMLRIRGERVYVYEFSRWL